MTSGTRLPTWKERENNKRRERRRRAIAAKIFAGLRMYGNYKLPKHCDNNEVLKALCNEAGWIVEEDGTTYRKLISLLGVVYAKLSWVRLVQFSADDRVSAGGPAGAGESIAMSKDRVLRLILGHKQCCVISCQLPCSPEHGCKPVERMDIMGSSGVSPCSSYRPSPGPSFNPSPISSSFASPVSSHFTNNTTNTNDPNSLIPWLKNLSSSGTQPPSSKFPHHLYIPGGSISAPVTPPLSSPTARTPRMNNDPSSNPAWQQHFPFLPSSTPQSPGMQTPPDSGWLSGVQTPQDGPSSPTFSLVAANPFGFREPVSNGGSRMWTPGQSGACSPAVAAGFDQTGDLPMCDAISAEFAFGSNNNKGIVKPWEGERIHDECVPDELELTLGN
ncbi:brassinosteroid signaling positive regulator-related protein, partial [Striga asiatica]